MENYLELFGEDGAKRVDLDASLTIGRKPGNALQLGDKSVSGTHALVQKVGGHYFLMDLGSSNGTLLNRQRVVYPEKLKNADEIRIGSCTIVFHRMNSGDEIDQAESQECGQTILAPEWTHGTLLILVVDVKNSTKMAEQMSAAAFAKVINTWFLLAAGAIEKHGGKVDKFIGDGILAVWQPRLENAKDELLSALKAIDGMSAHCATINEQISELNFPFSFGAAINVGDAVVGNVGLLSARDHTAMGDSVNLAFRIQDQLRKMKTDVALSPQAYELMPREFWHGKTHPCKLKGKTSKISILPLSFLEIGAIVR
jgi:class 3 adenylate cyclase